MAVRRYIKIGPLSLKVNMEISTLSSILIQEHENIASIRSVQSLLQCARGRVAQLFQVFKTPDLGPREMDILATLDC